MFTIKHCHDFTEDLYHSVDSVEGNLNQASPKYGVNCITRERIHFILGQDTPDSIPSQPEKGQRGIVFVMNENGKTIARYNV